jgi:hypothetical protein
VETEEPTQVVTEDTHNLPLLLFPALPLVFTQVEPEKMPEVMKEVQEALDLM